MCLVYDSSHEIIKGFSRFDSLVPSCDVLREQRSRTRIYVDTWNLIGRSMSDDAEIEWHAEYKTWTLSAL